MIQSGVAELMLASMARPGSCGPEFETDDGRLVDSAEFFGLGGMSDEEVAAHESAGRALRDAGSELATLLLSGCDGTPVELNTGYVCSSANKSAVELTEDDINGSASPEVRIMQDIISVARAATEGE